MEYIIDINIDLSPENKEKRRKATEKYWKEVQEKFAKIVGPNFKRVTPQKDVPRMLKHIEMLAKQVSVVFK